MAITPALRHKHSGLGWDGDKISWRDIEDKPSSLGGSIQIKKGFATRASGATGVQTITGIGFAPKMVVIQASGGGTGSCGMSDSDSDSSGSNCRIAYLSAGTWVMQGGLTNPVYVQQGANIARANVLTLLPDGFSLNWNIMDAGVEFQYKCFG